MNPITHGLLSWLVAEAAPLDRRGRLCVTLAGLLPDADGFGLPFELLTRHGDHPLLWWSEYHHVLGHGLAWALVVAGAAWAWTRRRLVAALAFATFHLHLLCDLVGARGPDGGQWPIRYWWPLSDAGWVWSGQWALNAWPNIAMTAGALIASLALAVRRGHSPLELVSSRADAGLVAILRRRFGRERPAP